MKLMTKFKTNLNNLKITIQKLEHIELTKSYAIDIMLN